MKTLTMSNKGLSRFFQYRSLVAMLVAKELKARYRGTFLGFLWSFLNPFLAMLTYVLVFSVYMKIQMENYSAFLLCGLLPWLWFSSAVGEASSAILSNGSLIKKIAMPVEIFPFVYVASNLMNFLFSLPILFFLLMFLKVRLGMPLLMFPVLLILQFMFTFGCALFVAGITVRFRDLLYLIPNLITIWYFLTPIMYPSSMVPERWKGMILVNPFAYFAIAYQDIFFYNKWPDFYSMLNVAVFSLFVLGAGYFVFQRLKESFPEEV